MHSAISQSVEYQVMAQDIVPVAPGTLLQMFPERHPEGQYLQDYTGWLGQTPVYYTGHPVFQVRSFIWDREGTHVTFDWGAGTIIAGGYGGIKYKKFPYPSPMFEVVDEAVARYIRADWETAVAIQRTRRHRRRWKWPHWLHFRKARLATA